MNSLPVLHPWLRRMRGLYPIASAAVDSLARQRRLQVDGLYQRLRGLDPQGTLSRGFAIVEHVDTATALTSIQQVHPGDALNITVADGTFPAMAGSEVDATPLKPIEPRKKVQKKKPAPASAALL